MAYAHRYSSIKNRFHVPRSGFHEKDGNPLPAVIPVKAAWNDDEIRLELRRAKIFWLLT